LFWNLWSVFSGGGFCLLPIAFCRGWHYIQISPKRNPGGGVWRQKPPGNLQYHYKIWSSKFQYEKSKERMFLMPSREEMIEYITETIQEASDLDLEQYFWLMMEQDTNFDSE
jgi:hypothetical protein